MDVRLFIVSAVSFLFTLLVLQQRRSSSAQLVPTQIVAAPSPAPSVSSPCQLSTATSSSHSLVPDDFFDFASPRRFNLDLRFMLPISNRKRMLTSRYRSPCSPDASGWMSNCGIVIVDKGGPGLKKLVDQFRRSEWSEAFPILILVKSAQAAALLSESFESAFRRVDVQAASNYQKSSRSSSSNKLFNFSLIVDSRLQLGGARAPSPVFLLDQLWHYDMMFVQLNSVSHRLRKKMKSGEVLSDGEKDADSLLNNHQLPNPFVFGVRYGACVDELLPLLASRSEWLSAAKSVRRVVLQRCPAKFSFMADYYAQLTTKRDKESRETPFANSIVL